jgi:hypothetical protein
MKSILITLCSIIFAILSIDCTKPKTNSAHLLQDSLREFQSSVVVPQTQCFLDTVWFSSVADRFHKRETLFYLVQSNKDTIRVHKYSVSPSQRYAVFDVVSGITKEPGIFQGEAPDADVYAILIVRLSDNKLMRRVEIDDTPGALFIGFDRWLREDRILISGSDGLGVSNSYVYSPVTDSLITVPWDYYEK